MHPSRASSKRPSPESQELHGPVCVVALRNHRLLLLGKVCAAPSSVFEVFRWLGSSRRRRGSASSCFWPITVRPRFPHDSACVLDGDSKSTLGGKRPDTGGLPVPIMASLSGTRRDAGLRLARMTAIDSHRRAEVWHSGRSVGCRITPREVRYALSSPAGACSDSRPHRGV